MTPSPRSRLDGGGRLVLLLSGPNLDLLGERQPDVYGRETLAEHVAVAAEEAGSCGLVVEHHQTNHEGELVELVHGAAGRAAAIVVNAGALSHYSWSLHDALADFDGVVVELHLSNPSAREPWRHTSVVAPVADGTVSGFGRLGYRLAVRAVAELLALIALGGEADGSSAQRPSAVAREDTAARDDTVAREDTAACEDTDTAATRGGLR